MMYKKYIAYPFILILFMAGLGIPHAPADAAVSDWQKGGSIWPRSERDFESDSFKQSVVQLKQMGADYVTLVIPYYQSNLYSTDIGRGWNTPPDDTLRAAADYIHSQGMKVMFKPHLESYTGEWRAYINPGDRDGWFRNYGAVLQNLAGIARDHSVEELCIGTELISMATATSDGRNTQSWRNLISAIRSTYSGNVTYSANWGGFWFGDEKNHIEFWDALDYIGISGYFGLGDDGSVQSMKNTWHNWNGSDIKPLADRWNKPILFTEVGYRSVSGAHREPWNSGMGGNADEWEQVRDYDALMSYWNDYGYLAGIHIWDWESYPNAGGSWTTSYTPQNKQAYTTIKNWFSSPTLPSTGGETNNNTPAFTAGVTVSPEAPLTGSPMSITANLSKTTDGTLGGTIVDVEARTSDDTKIFQQAFDGVTWTGKENKSFTAQWTPQDPGTYIIKIGVFNGDWTTNYYWNGDARTVTVMRGSESGGGTTPPSTNNTGTTLDVWWPSDGVTVSGVQPFKGIITDRDLSTYQMFWQVDGDRLNSMYDAPEGWPHKESMVDLSGWNWKTDNSYLLNFVAKDNNGNPINEKSSRINVAR